MCKFAVLRSLFAVESKRASLASLDKQVADLQAVRAAEAAELRTAEDELADVEHQYECAKRDALTPGPMGQQQLVDRMESIVNQLPAANAPSDVTATHKQMAELVAQFRASQLDEQSVRAAAAVPLLDAEAPLADARGRCSLHRSRACP